MSILCATDFSERSDRAAAVAARLAARRGLPLWLVHAASAQALRVAREPVSEGLQALLREKADRLASLGAEVQAAVLEGAPAAALKAFVQKHGCTLLVVGAPGSGGPFARLGGTLDRIAQASTVPLLRVPASPHLEPWLSGEQPLHVMLAADRSGATQAARAWLTELRRYGPLQLEVGHVYYPRQEHRRLGLPQPRGPDAVSTDLLAALSDEMAALAAPRDGSTPPAVCLHKGMWPLGEELVTLAVRERIELLVLGRHPRGGLGRLWGVTHHALHHAPMAVVLVPDDQGAQEAAALPVLHRLLVATDFSAQGDAAIPFAFALAPEGATVHLVTVEASTLTQEARRAQQRLLRQRVPPQARLRGVSAQVEVLSGSSVADTLAKAAERFNADLVCLSSHGRGGLGRALLGSVAHQTLSHCRRPVLVVQSPLR